jgi:aminotransferase
MTSPLARLAARRAHLETGNLLRSLTEVINKVQGGINLGQGVCDMDSPAPLRQGAVDAIAGGTDRQTYTFYCGLPETRAAIAQKLNRFNGLDVTPEQVLVASGSSGAFFAACMTLLDPGDEVILFEPFYSYHYTALKLVGAVPVCVPLVGNDFALDPDSLRAAITKKTRAVMVNTPANPSGKVFTAQDLGALAAVVSDTDALVFTDEVYEHMCYDGLRHISPATVEGLHERTLTISSFSKTYSITGWRVGYLAGPEDTIDAIGRVYDQIEVCAARPMQRGVERALRELPDSYYTDLQATYESKRDQFCAALEAHGFRITRPQGAYYVMADYTEVFGDLEPHPAVLKMIESLGINGVPGHIFYQRPENIRSIRFQFAVEQEVLDEVCRRLTEGWEQAP